RAALAVSVTADVVRRQEQVVSALTRTGATVHRHYLPGAWMPHISLVTAGATGQLPLIARTVSAVLPLRAQVVAAALIDSSTGESSPLPTIP
ncbi:MAG TPA: 2'-5' RNA ligase family protein, partial [Brevibacterium sp.]|nr:2'-5' RNA ligase family protein [Brevibacterium sp.]